MTETKVLPCPNPWCKPDNSRILYEHSTTARKQIACMCGLNGPYCDTREDAIAAWNTRTPDPRNEAAEVTDEMLAKRDKNAFDSGFEAGYYRTQERDAAAQGLADALREAAESLNTVATQAGKDEYLHDIYQIRGYAHSRATVARAALAAWEKAQ